MKYYAGIDVSLESASVCVVDEKGLIVREGGPSKDDDCAPDRCPPGYRSPGNLAQPLHRWAITPRNGRRGRESDDGAAFAATVGR